MKECFYRKNSSRHVECTFDNTAKKKLLEVQKMYSFKFFHRNRRNFSSGDIDTVSENTNFLKLYLICSEKASSNSKAPISFMIFSFKLFFYHFRPTVYEKNGSFAAFLVFGLTEMTFPRSQRGILPVLVILFNSVHFFSCNSVGIYFIFGATSKLCHP